MNRPQNWREMVCTMSKKIADVTESWYHTVKQSSNIADFVVDRKHDVPRLAEASSKFSYLQAKCLTTSSIKEYKDLCTYFQSCSTLYEDIILSYHTRLLHTE